MTTRPQALTPLSKPLRIPLSQRRRFIAFQEWLECTFPLTSSELADIVDYLKANFLREMRLKHKTTPTRAQLLKLARFSDYLLKHYRLTSAMVYAIAHGFLYQVMGCSGQKRGAA